MGEYLAQWLEGKQSLRPSTLLSYSTHIRVYLIPHLGDITLAELRPLHIQLMVRALMETEDGTTRLSTATLMRIHATLMSALTTAVRQGLIDRNPAETVELPTMRRRRQVVWSAAQLAEFLGDVVDDDLYPLVLILSLYGLRRGEAVGLRWCDVDLDTAQLQVSQQLVVVGSEVVAGEPKSKAGHRVIALDDTTVRLLLGHRDLQHLRQQIAGADWVETGLVFTEPNGVALDPAYVSRHFDRLVARSGLPRIRLHDLRHTSASIGLASGESLLEVSRRLGHSSIAITADVYSHVSPAVARESAERRSRHIFKH